jgi:beta-1,4-glucosyltransferase
MDVEQIIHISQFPIQSTRREQLAARLLSAMDRNEKRVLLFANTNFIVNCRFLIEHSGDPTIILVNDGVGMDIAARLLRLGKFQENLNGTDFTPFLFKQSPRPLRIFLLGGSAEVLAKAVTYVTDTLGQVVAGSCDGYGGLKNTPNIDRLINNAAPDVILVAMGNPLQEKWILAHRDNINARLCMGVGALFNFWSGGKSRAPTIIRKLRLEWFYRLCLEPKRLLRRYTLDILIFLQQCFKYK